MYNKCAFSGHRVLKSDFDNQLLYRVTENLIRTGTEEFLCGMARGFDLAAAQCVLELKKNYDIKLVACIPCLTQSESFSKKDREIYEKVIENCDEKVILSENYYRGCMQVRNRYLVENCDVLVCYLREESGGTFYTVKYAEELEKHLVKL